MLNCIQLCATPWAVAHQAPLSVEFSRQEYWSGLPFPSLGDLSDTGIKLASSALAGGFFTAEQPERPQTWRHPQNQEELVSNCKVSLRTDEVWD